MVVLTGRDNVPMVLALVGGLRADSDLIMMGPWWSDSTPGSLSGKAGAGGGAGGGAEAGGGMGAGGGAGAGLVLLPALEEEGRVHLAGGLRRLNGLADMMGLGEG